MKKILIVCSAYPPDIKGGGEKSTQILAQSLSERGHDVLVLTAADKKGVRLDTDGKTRIRAICSPNIFWNFRIGQSLPKKIIWHLLDNYNPYAQRAIEKDILQYKPDIVVTSTIENFGPSIWQVSRRLNIPVIHILRSYYIRCFKGTMFYQGSNCKTSCTRCLALTFGRRFGAKHVDGLVGISQFILAQHKSLFPTALHTVISNAVSLVTAPIKLRKTGNIVTFGYLGRIEPEKGIAEILEVFRKLPENCHLLVAGHGKPDYEKQLRLKYSSGRITFLGWVEADAVYSKIDFAVIPSLWNEPFGRVVIEAYSQGIPVVAAARGGLSELVREGRTGYLYDPTDPGDLHSACLRAVQGISSYDDMVAAVKTEAQRYSPSEIGEQYEKFIEQILTRKNANT